MKTLITILKTLGFLVAYFVIIAIVGVIFPMESATKPDASTMGALLLHLMVNSFFIIFLLRRLSLKGFSLIAATAVSVYGLQIFMTQIETWIFIKSFPQITPYLLFTIFTSNLIQIFAITIVGYFIWKPSLTTDVLNKESNRLKRKGWKLAILSVTYMILYFTFGYFVAWQLESLKDFYRNTVIGIGNVELAFIQITRGALWVLLCLPIVFNLKGGRSAKLVIVPLMMALLPTILLLMPNPFMPFPIRMTHFVEVFLSNGIFGILISLLMTPKQKLMACS